MNHASFLPADNPPDGGIDWLGGESKESSDFGSYERFIAGVSDIVMGHTTYRQLTTQLLPGTWPYAAQKTHVLTHRDLHLHPVWCTWPRASDPPGTGRWCSPADLEGLGLPTPIRRLLTASPGEAGTE